MRAERFLPVLCRKHTFSVRLRQISVVCRSAANWLDDFARSVKGELMVFFLWVPPREESPPRKVPVTHGPRTMERSDLADIYALRPSILDNKPHGPDTPPHPKPVRTPTHWRRRVVNWSRSRFPGCYHRRQ